MKNKLFSSLFEKFFEYFNIKLKQSLNNIGRYS